MCCPVLSLVRSQSQSDVENQKLRDGVEYTPHSRPHTHTKVFGDLYSGLNHYGSLSYKRKKLNNFIKRKSTKLKTIEGMTKFIRSCQIHSVTKVIYGITEKIEKILLCKVPLPTYILSTKD